MDGWIVECTATLIVICLPSILPEFALVGRSSHVDCKLFDLIPPYEEFEFTHTSQRPIVVTTTTNKSSQYFNMFS